MEISRFPTWLWAILIAAIILLVIGFVSADTIETAIVEGGGAQTITTEPHGYRQADNETSPEAPAAPAPTPSTGGGGGALVIDDPYQVSVTTDQPSYQAGETITATITINEYRTSISEDTMTIQYQLISPSGEITNTITEELLVSDETSTITFDIPATSQEGNWSLQAITEVSGYPPIQKTTSINVRTAAYTLILLLIALIVIIVAIITRRRTRGEEQ